MPERADLLLSVWIINQCAFQKTQPSRDLPHTRNHQITLAGKLSPSSVALGGCFSQKTLGNSTVAALYSGRSSFHFTASEQKPHASWNTQRCPSVSRRARRERLYWVWVMRVHPPVTSANEPSLWTNPADTIRLDGSLSRESSTETPLQSRSKELLSADGHGALRNQSLNHRVISIEMYFSYWPLNVI